MKPSTAAAGLLATAAYPTSSFVLFDRDSPRHGDRLLSRFSRDTRSVSCMDCGRVILLIQGATANPDSVVSSNQAAGNCFGKEGEDKPVSVVFVYVICTNFM